MSQNRLNDVYIVVYMKRYETIVIEADEFVKNKKLFLSLYILDYNFKQ